MKKIVTQRSLEERAKFFKKNLGKVSLAESSSNAPIVEEKKAVLVHETVEASANVEEIKKEEEELELDDLAITEEHEEEEQGNDEDEDDEDDDDDEEDDDDDEFKLDL